MLVEQKKLQNLIFLDHSDLLKFFILVRLFVETSGELTLFGFNKCLKSTIGRTSSFV